MQNVEQDNQSSTDVVVESTSLSEMSNQPVFWQIVILLVVLISIFSTAIVNELSQYAAQRDEQTEISQNTPPPQAAAVITNKEPDPLANVDVLAQSAIVWDVRDQKMLYAKNENEILPLASITKLMTSLLAHELLEENETIRIGVGDIKQSGDSGLSDGEYFALENLNDLVLMTSSNDGAHALATTGGNALGLNGADAFVTAMNVRAEQLGFDTLQFLNPTGLDLAPGQGGAFGSAHDVALLMEHIITVQPDILDATTQTFDSIYNASGEYHNAQNTNSTVNQIEGLIGSKTGYTDLAGGNLAIAFEAGLNRPIIIVVLGSTRTGRFEDVLELAATTRKSISR